ncbi:hypothetical protein TNCV_1124341 [Trichonephila clavipes]|uniref:Uncharacterized protein n=1 Tax=Trichonephila clavipes TaxID=2585209 RepID=A0A8X6VAC2_TRICX|nr:hypothetical protein TNCV_1124341 [Trichonephila clavipes]
MQNFTFVMPNITDYPDMGLRTVLTARMPKVQHLFFVSLARETKLAEFFSLFLNLHAEIVEVEIEVLSPSIVPSVNFAELNRTVTCMVLKANDRRTSCPCHDEFRGPRSDYVRQAARHHFIRGLRITALSDFIDIVALMADILKAVVGKLCNSPAQRDARS